MSTKPIVKVYTRVVIDVVIVVVISGYSVVLPGELIMKNYLIREGNIIIVLLCTDLRFKLSRLVVKKSFVN